MKKKSLVIFLHQNIWDQSSLEALEVEKYKKSSDIVAYELGHFVNKDLVPAFKRKLKKRYIIKSFSFHEWKKHILTLLKKYNKNKILIINKVKPTNFWGFLILIELSKLNLNIVEYQNSGMPKFSNIKTFNEKFKIIFDFSYVMKILRGRIFNFLSKFLKFHNYSYLISGFPNKELKKKKIIYGSSWDMTKLFNNSKKTNLNYNYAVYVESTIAHDGDQIILGPNAVKLDKKRWFKNLNNFFNFIEYNYNLKIVIASHPKIDHKKNSNIYGHRKVIKDKARDLIQNANLVFLERSSAINFVIKFKKPAMIIHNEETISTSYNKRTHIGLSKLTGIRNIDIEKFSKKDLKDLYFVNKDKYLHFYKKYMNFKNIKLPNYIILKKKYLSL